ncbi:DUF3231 family protein [Priestia aryabhattai]|uniref:DUF3231 family protein n=1 Tax=Priestia aryabhattai TaxID=412384 RepID=UPI001874C1E1|nr:DUF3231 family protein [Priestia aryabhattai]MBE5099596.1 DUF3231 family protein [Priestia aryabhattai]
MPDLLQALKSVVQSFIKDENKTPLHIGEAMGCWIFLALAGETQVQTEAGINSTTDPELRKALQEAVNMFKSQKERMIAFMLSEGVPIPPLSESKPKSNPSDVPLGVKLTDDELANSLNIKMVILITYCANAIIQSARNDVTLIWIEYLQEYMAFGATLKELVKKRGWLKVPPYYYAPGAPIK